VVKANELLSAACEKGKRTPSKTLDAYASKSEAPVGSFAVFRRRVALVALHRRVEAGKRERCGAVIDG